MDNPEKFSINKRLRLRTGLVLTTFLVIAAFFLLAEHRAHFFGILPYALLLIALLMFIFIRRGQSDNSPHEGHPPEERK